MAYIRPKFEVQDTQRKVQDNLNKGVKKVAIKWVPKLIKFARLNHEYKNRTWQLTRTTNGIYNPFKNIITLFAPAQSPRGYYYGRVVADRKGNWLENSFMKNSKSIKNDLKGIFK